MVIDHKICKFIRIGNIIKGIVFGAKSALLPVRRANYAARTRRLKKPPQAHHNHFQKLQLK